MMTKKTEMELFKPFALLSKADIETKVQVIKYSVSEGLASSLDTLVMAKKIGVFAKELESAVRDIAEGETTLKTGETYVRHSIKVIQKEAGVKYDYSACGDPILAAYEEGIAELDQKRKDREAFLKALKEPLTYADPATGEMIEIKPPIRMAKLGLNLTLI